MIKRLADYKFTMLLGLLSSLLLIWGALQTSVDRTNTQQDKFPKADYYLNDFSMMSYGHDGLPESLINGKYLEHFSVPDLVKIELPVLILMALGEKVWKVSANFAYVVMNSEILLFGDVKIDKITTTVNNDLAIKTSSLRILPKQKFLTTNDEFFLTSVAGNLTGVGLEIDFEHKKIKLLDKVKGIYHAGVVDE